MELVTQAYRKIHTDKVVIIQAKTLASDLKVVLIQNLNKSDIPSEIVI